MLTPTGGSARRFGVARGVGYQADSSSNFSPLAAALRRASTKHANVEHRGSAVRAAAAGARHLLTAPPRRDWPLDRRVGLKRRREHRADLRDEPQSAWEPSALG